MHACMHDFWVESVFGSIIAEVILMSSFLPERSNVRVSIVILLRNETTLLEILVYRMTQMRFLTWGSKYVRYLSFTKKFLVDWFLRLLDVQVLGTSVKSGPQREGVGREGWNRGVDPSLRKLSFKSGVAHRRVLEPVLKVLGGPRALWVFLFSSFNFKRILRSEIQYVHRTRCPKPCIDQGWHLSVFYNWVFHSSKKRKRKRKKTHYISKVHVLIHKCIMPHNSGWARANTQPHINNPMELVCGILWIRI